MFVNDLTAVRYIGLRTEAKDLQAKISLSNKRVGMSQQELQASYDDEIDQIKKLIIATEQLTDLTESAMAKTADELEEAKALIEGLQKQQANSKKK